MHIADTIYWYSTNSITCFHEVSPWRATAVMHSSAALENLKAALIYYGNGNYHNILLLGRQTPAIYQAAAFTTLCRTLPLIVLSLNRGHLLALDS